MAKSVSNPHGFRPDLILEAHEGIRALARKNPERGRVLTDPGAYRVNKRRTTIDGDCDFQEWGDVYDLIVRLETGVSVTVSVHDSHAEAMAWRDVRCASLTSVAPEDEDDAKPPRCYDCSAVLGETQHIDCDGQQICDSCHAENVAADEEQAEIQRLADEGLSPKTLLCDMAQGCSEPITHVDNRGFVYCTRHGIARRSGGTPCRKLKTRELATLQRGETIRYR